MRKKKVEKIRKNIVLSIRYARLKEEIRDAEANIIGISEKKKFVFTEKKIDKSNEIIESAQKIIGEIEKNYSPNDYLIIENNQAHQQLALLSKQKNFELIKYSIALEIIMDISFNYTDAAFIEKISLILFNNVNIMKKMEDDYQKISAKIYGKSLATYLETAAKVLKAVKVVKFGLDAGAIALERRKEAKKLSTFASGELANRLIIDAMNLVYAKEHFEGIKYDNYFKYILKAVNLERRIIMKEIFEEQREVDENKSKLKLLYNFDNYMIEQMRQI